MLRWKRKRARFDKALLSHLDALYRFAVFLTGNEGEAEDLIQDTLVNALRKFHQFRPGTNLKAWLYRIARNAHIDHIRRQRREPEISELNESAAAREGGDGTDGDFARWKGLTIDNERVLFDQFGDEVNRFLRELPAEFRIALILCDIEGLTYEEISQVIACPVGTVRSRISRARSHLREKLYDYAKELGYVKEPSS